jgi:hypothetical protein
METWSAEYIKLRKLEEENNFEKLYPRRAARIA